jgi:hypothetical protein
MRSSRRLKHGRDQLQNYSISRPFKPSARPTGVRLTPPTPPTPHAEIFTPPTTSSRLIRSLLIRSVLIRSLTRSSLLIPLLIRLRLIRLLLIRLLLIPRLIRLLVIRSTV